MARIQTPIERLRAAVDSERLRRDLIDVIGEYGDVREWADALTELADALEEAGGEIETWADEEDREERASARETALESLQAVVEAYDQAAALPGLDLWENAEEPVRYQGEGDWSDGR